MSPKYKIILFSTSNQKLSSQQLLPKILRSPLKINDKIRLRVLRSKTLRLNFHGTIIFRELVLKMSTNPKELHNLPDNSILGKVSKQNP